MSKQRIELLPVNIELVSKILLQCISLDNNTLLGLINVLNATQNLGLK